MHGGAPRIARKCFQVAARRSAASCKGWPWLKPMTSKSVTVPVLNSLLFIRDKNIRSLPEIDGHSSVWSTPSCVAVSCLPDSDGETRVIIGSAEDVRRDGDPLFDARLMTPSGHVIVENVLGERILGDWGTETRYAGDGVDERFS